MNIILSEEDTETTYGIGCNPTLQAVASSTEYVLTEYNGMVSLWKNNQQLARFNLTEQCFKLVPDHKLRVLA